MRQVEMDRSEGPDRVWRHANASDKFGVAFIAVLAVVVVSCPIVQPWLLVRSVRSIPVGMLEADVLKRLGQPDEAGQSFHLGQKAGYETQYREAAESSSVRYLFWHGGVVGDFVCAVGLDQDARVAFTACGGT